MITVPSHATMIEALLKIDEHKVSALPVVDVQGATPTFISLPRSVQCSPTPAWAHWVIQGI